MANGYCISGQRRCRGLFSGEGKTEGSGPREAKAQEPSVHRGTVCTHRMLKA